MQILSFLVYFFAWLVGSFRNPFMWGFAAVCAYIAIDRAKWFWPGIVATVYTGFDIFMGYRWWKEIGEDRAMLVGFLYKSCNRVSRVHGVSECPAKEKGFHDECAANGAE